MDRIAGKYNALFFLFLSFLGVICSAQQGELKLYSHDGMPLKKAGIGQPFMLKFTASYQGNQMQEPVLEGTHGLNVQRTGFQLQTINRTSEATYTYMARAKKAGTYVIGPVRYLHEGKERLSNTVTVQVAHNQEIDTQAVNTKQKKYAFARLMVSKDSAYVGEKITHTIRFYYQDPSTEIEHLVRPELNAFTIAEQKQGYAGKEKIKDEMYHFFEWSWDLYPTQVGTHTIGAHRLDFMQSRDRDDRFSRFNMFFGPQVDRRRVYTNEVSIEIKPLPTHTRNVAGIGSFKSLKAHIEPALSKEGEAMVFSLELEGEGNLDAVQFPTVQNLPDCFRSYSSKQYIRSDKKDVHAKVFEFIVQGMKSGDWEIPTQECCYFDVDSGQYKELRTSPLSIRVLPAAHVITSSKGETKEIDTEVNIVLPDELHPLMTTWGTVNVERSIPFVWLFILALLPLMFMLIWHTHRYICTRFFAYQRAPSWATLFKQARVALQDAQKQNDVSKVYPLLVTLVAGLQKKPVTKITQEYMEHVIDDEKWHAYVRRASEYAFYTPDTDELAFFAEGFVWLDRLEGVK